MLAAAADGLFRGGSFLRLTHSIHQGRKFIRTGCPRQCAEIQAENLPAAGSGEALGVELAQVIAVRLGVGGQGSKHCG